MTEKMNLPPVDQNRRYEIDTAAAYLGCSRGRVYAKVKLGELRLIKDGRRSYIPGVDLIAAATP